jgi:GDP-L-fucose synthase
MLGIHNPDNLINVGTGTDIRISELAETIAKVVGYVGKIRYDTSKPEGTPRKLLDLSKIHSYGWTHQIDIEDGLNQTYSWFVNSFEKGAVRGF